MRVKVCGITQEEQLLQLPDAGVSFAGFIFYPKSSKVCVAAHDHQPDKERK